jgi:hypothetical protein
MAVQDARHLFDFQRGQQDRRERNALSAYLWKLRLPVFVEPNKFVFLNSTVNPIFLLSNPLRNL